MDPIEVAINRATIDRNLSVGIEELDDATFDLLLLANDDAVPAGQTQVGPLLQILGTEDDLLPHLVLFHVEVG